MPSRGVHSYMVGVWGAGVMGIVQGATGPWVSAAWQRSVRPACTSPRVVIMRQKRNQVLNGCCMRTVYRMESNRAFTKKFLLKAGGECLPLLHTHTAWTHRNVRRTAPDPTSDWRGTRLRCSGGSTTDYPPRGAAAQRFNPVFSATPTSATLLRSAAFSVCSLPSCSCSRSSLSWSRRLRALAWF